MAGTVILSFTRVDREAVEAKATQVGADILAQYQQLATNLRRRGSDEAAAMSAKFDPTERASGQCAFQLYCTAASELDDIIAELLDSLQHPASGTTGPSTLLVFDGGKADRATGERQPR
ncbi:hypothetical protein ACRAWG_06115 [Methylobacterium sp. P31]